MTTTTAPSECVDVKVSTTCLEVLGFVVVVVLGGTVEVVKVVSDDLLAKGTRTIDEK